MQSKMSYAFERLVCMQWPLRHQKNTPLTCFNIKLLMKSPVYKIVVAEAQKA